MYIPDLNVFFIHIPKCAGVSVEVFFFHRDGINVRPKHIVPQLSDKQKQKYRFGDYLRKYDPKANARAQHFTALEASECVQEFKDCYTFAFIRNPWDRFISEFFWRTQIIKQDITTDELIEKSEKEIIKGRDGHCHLIPQWLYVYDDNENKLVNDVFKIENINNAEKSLSSRLDLSVNFSKSNNSIRNHYLEYYTPYLQERIGNLYQKDIELFGYSFNDKD